MVGTVRAARHRGRIGVAAGAGAYAAGLALGAALLFGSLGAAGAALHPGRVAALVAGALAAAAVLADLAGLRVRPQVRFQVPEPWRRTMPLTRALFLYGVLLGTGVSTFVPAAAVWALLPLSVALGSVGSALAIGLSFAVGRALPVLALTAHGDETALAERPRGLRVVRILAAVSLGLALVAGAARAASTVAAPAEDPSAIGTDLVWQEPGVGGFLLRNGVRTQLPGSDPAVGGSYIAWHIGDIVTVAALDTLTPVLNVSVPGVEKLAVSQQWLAFRVRRPNGSEQIQALALSDPSTTIAVSRPRPRGQLGRPTISGNGVLYHLALPTVSRLFAFGLVSRKAAILRSSQHSLLLSPVRVGNQLLYVRLDRCSQQLRVGPVDGNGAGRVLYKLPPLAGEDLGFEPGHTEQGRRIPCPGRPKPTARSLWTAAISGTTAYVTVLRPGKNGQSIPSLLSVTLGSLR
jgi:hypothetical protein